jgi:antitoxin component YwqK of YwqJK toxin-antitoxin module
MGVRSGELVGGKKDGPWVSYFANGAKMSEGTYRLGEKEGAWVLYWPNGNKRSEAAFVGGKYTGLYTCYYENGNKQWEGYYNPIRGNSADGTKEGVWLVYDKDSAAISRTVTYKRGGRVKPDEYPPFDEPPKIGPPPTER